MMSSVTWNQLAEVAPALVTAGNRLFTEHQVVFLATVRKHGGPRIHPVVPVVSRGELYVFVSPNSPKCGDLHRNALYALHTMLGADDEEFSIQGIARVVDDPGHWRIVADDASYPVESGQVLFTLGIETCLWVTWERVGLPDTQPLIRRWPESAWHVVHRSVLERLKLPPLPESVAQPCFSEVNS